MPPSWELDLSADIVPPIYDVVLDRSGAGPWSVTWRLEGEATIADAYFGMVEWADQAGDHDWLFLLPPDRTDSFLRLDSVIGPEYTQGTGREAGREQAGRQAGKY